jgi:hypothetical protein
MAESEQRKKYREELFKLMQENPELPVVPMVDGEIPGDDSGYWLGAWGSARVDEYAESFDQDEHIEMWIEARHNGVRGVPSTRELVKDAEEIESMLKELSEALLETELQRESI